MSKTKQPDLAGIQKAVGEVLPSKEMKCPHCDASIHFSYTAQIPKRQVLTMTLTSESGNFSAQTLGAVVTNFDKLLKAVARDVGGQVHNFIDSLELKEKSVKVGFLITSVK